VSDHRVREERRQAEEALAGLRGQYEKALARLRGQYEKALASLRRQYELLPNSAGEGIYGIDLDGNIIFINSKAAELLKWTVAGLLGKPAHATIHHTKSDGSKYPVEACPAHASLRTGATRRVANDVFWRKDGKPFRVGYVSAPIKGKRGHIVGAVVIFRDITEPKRAEERMIGLLSIGISRGDRPK